MIKPSICSAENFINLGRALQRLWLLSTVRELSIQPISGAIYLAQRIQAGDNFLPKKLADRILEAQDTVIKEFGLSKEIPGLLFRIGYADPPSAVSSHLKPKYI